jgi:hypothetical protein
MTGWRRPSPCADRRRGGGRSGLRGADAWRCRPRPTSPARSGSDVDPDAIDRRCADALRAGIGAALSRPAGGEALAIASPRPAPYAPTRPRPAGAALSKGALDLSWARRRRRDRPRRRAGPVPARRQHDRPARRARRAGQPAGPRREAALQSLRASATATSRSSSTTGSHLQAPFPRRATLDRVKKLTATPPSRWAIPTACGR